MEKTFELAPQTRAATFQSSSVDEKARTIEMTWSTGSAVKRFDWESFQVVNEELSLEKDAIRMDRLNSGAPFLNAHNSYRLESVLGVVEKAWVDTAARARVRFHDDSQDKEPVVEPIWRKIVSGIIRNVSVGYLVHQFRDITKKGEKMRTLLAVDWEPVEISAVPIGADPGAGFRSLPEKTSCRVISEDEPDPALRDVMRRNSEALAEVINALPAFDFRTLRMVDANGVELSPEDFANFLRSQHAAKQIPAGVTAPPDYRALRARLELLKVA